MPNKNNKENIAVKIKKILLNLHQKLANYRSTRKTHNFHSITSDFSTIHGLNNSNKCSDIVIMANPVNKNTLDQLI